MDTKTNMSRIRIDSILTENQMIRAEMSDDHVIELANSISKLGLLQPIVVKLLPGGKHQLLAGAHRLAACKRLHWTHIPAVIKTDLDIEPIKGIALVENLIRKDMSLEEECNAMKILTEEQDMSISQVCQLVGRSRDWVMKRLTVPNYPDDIREPLFDNRITLAAADLIAQLEDEGARGYIINEAIYAKRSLFEIKVMVETFKATPDIASAIDKGVEEAQKISQNRSPKKACDYGGEATNMHEMRVLWLCSVCVNEIMAIRDLQKTETIKGGTLHDTIRKD